MKLLGRNTAPAPIPSPTADAETQSAELLAQRERLTERFALMQTELGGLFYEMAVRDHITLEVLIEKAAALQRIDIELAQIGYLLDTGDRSIGGHCPNCGIAHARGAAFCSQCASPLEQRVA